MMMALAWILFGLGALVCLTNLYLSVIRYALHRLRGLPRDSYHFASGLPLVGSLFVALSLIGLWEVSAMIPVAIGLILIDTGGIHWFAGVMIYHFLHEKGLG